MHDRNYRIFFPTINFLNIMLIKNILRMGNYRVVITLQYPFEERGGGNYRMGDKYSIYVIYIYIYSLNFLIEIRRNLNNKKY